MIRISRSAFRVSTVSKARSLSRGSGLVRVERQSSTREARRLLMLESVDSRRMKPLQAGQSASRSSGPNIDWQRESTSAQPTR